MKIDRAEFEKLTLEHLDMLYRIARRLTRDSATAEDLVQETYLRALRSHTTFDLKEYGIRPWLLRILHNLHSSRYQREKRQPVSIDDEQLAATPQSAGLPGQDGQPMTPERLWDGMDQQLVQAVEALPQEYQSVLLLWAVDELSYKEIADALEIPIGTVMSRLFRARQRLSEQLGDFAVREGIIRELPKSIPSPGTPG